MYKGILFVNYTSFELYIFTVVRLEKSDKRAKKWCNPSPKPAVIYVACWGAPSAVSGACRAPANNAFFSILSENWAFFVQF